MKQIKQKMAVILSLALVLAMAGEFISLPAVSKAAGYSISNPVINNGVTTWSCVYFGNYYQSNENTKEPIKWRVLSVDGDDAFLLADQNLDCQQYNITDAKSIFTPTPEPTVNPEATATSEPEPTVTPEPTETPKITWENCTLRSWLNGYGSDSNLNEKDYSNDNFLDAAFSPAEQEAIRQTVVTNGENPYYAGQEGNEAGMKGNDTTDRIYLLSIAEAATFRYGFSMDFKGGNDARISTNTAHVETKNTAMYSAGMADSWWLRTPGISLDQAAYVGLGGYGYENGYVVDFRFCAVRPVLHLDLSSSLWRNAGAVTSVVSSENALRNTSRTTNSTTTATQKVQKPGKITGLTVSVKKKKMTVSWKKKAGISGYQLQYAQNKKFTKKKKTKNIKNYLRKKTVTGLKRKQTYYVRVRAYKKVSGKNYYGKWSKVKKIKTK